MSITRTYREDLKEAHAEVMANIADYQKHRNWYIREYSEAEYTADLQEMQEQLATITAELRKL